MDPLSVSTIDFHVRENAKENHTEEYDLVKRVNPPVPVLRRGEDFSFTVCFDRVFDEEYDVVRVNFQMAPSGDVSKGTKVKLLVQVKQKEVTQDNQWSVGLIEKNDNIITLKVHIPYNAQVGIWKCGIRTNISGKSERNHHKNKDDIYILFNPWCKDDPVYMESEQREEYVLNELGKIWTGTFRDPASKRWLYGQFDEDVLPATFLLLERSDLPHSERGSVVLMARAISSVINGRDNDGLLEGRWDGEYSDGTSPFDWTGSTAIMERFLKTGGQSVKYGQCWVFSAATVTVCRALGIPCRSVTNYVSAHDTDRSLTVDKYFDLFGDVIEHGPRGDSNDSCWNFHVWNEVWMTRPDLPEGYGGWQVIDGTPQEPSEDIYRCGPTSVKAVREGEVKFPYDTSFVYSEVNADLCNFQEEEGAGFSRMSINRYQVGRKVLTKAADKTDFDGNSDMWDITASYKNLEGSEADRKAVAKAIEGVELAQQLYKIPPRTAEDVFFDLINMDSVLFGQDFEVVVQVQNNSSQDRSIRASVSASSVHYTGATAHRIENLAKRFILGPGQSEELKIHVKLAEYLYRLADHGLIKTYAIARVEETNQSWCEEDDITLKKPELHVHVDGPAQVNQECNVTFRFTNPIHITLTQCRYTIEGLGIQKQKSEDFRDVKGNETITFSETFVPRRIGNSIIVATFNSKQVQGIAGSAHVTVH